MPFTNLVIRINIDYSVYGEDFKIDNDFSTPVLVYKPNYTSNLIAVYANVSVTGKDLYAKLTLDGNNQESYRLSRDVIKFNLVAQVLPEPSITVTVSETKKTSVTLALNPNQKGVFVY